MILEILYDLYNRVVFYNLAPKLNIIFFAKKLGKQKTYMIDLY